jgi:hypothetical protein
MRDESNAAGTRCGNRQMNGRVIQGDLRPRCGHLLQDRPSFYSWLSDVCGGDHLKPERKERLGGVSPCLSPDIRNRYL